MVEGARPSRRAIARSDSPAASPREISSRSPKLKTRGERVRGDWAIPPCPQITRRTVSVGCASVAPTTTVECPARHPVQIALIASTVSRLYRLATDPPPMHVNLLRPPVETTQQNGRIGVVMGRVSSCNEPLSDGMNDLGGPMNPEVVLNFIWPRRNNLSSVPI